MTTWYGEALCISLPFCGNFWVPSGFPSLGAITVDVSLLLAWPSFFTTVELPVICTTDGSYHSYEISFESSGLCVIWTSNEIHMKFIWNYFIWIWPPNFIWTSYELHEKLPDNSCIFPTKFVRSSYEVLVKFIWIESFCYICISSEVHMNFIWNSYVIMCEISKWPWFSYVFHSKFIWHTDQNFQMKFHTNDTNRPS